ncbi:MAG: oligosaccharide flippase family protein [Bacillota bacterium]
MTNYINEKAQKGLKWTAIKTLFNSIIQPFYRILLALLLIPSDFAYIAVITLIVSFAEMLNNVGVGEAVIQRDNVTRKDLSSLYFFNLIITFLIASLLFLSSSSIAAYYSMSELDLIVKALSITVILNGSTSLFKFFLHKEFYFKETTLIQAIKITFEILVSIILILIGYGIWGYVIGILVSSAVHGILLTYNVFRKTNFKISFFISMKNLTRFLNFGIFVSGKKTLTFISHRLDEVIIGGLLSAEVLGAYYLAKNILLQFQTLITTSFGQVLLPLFSNLKNDLNLLKRYYINILSIVTLVSFPVFVGVILTAQYFVPLIFGEEWALSIGVFKLLAIPVIFEVLSAGITSSLLYSQNKTLLVFIIDLIFAIGYVILLFVFNNNALTNIIYLYSGYIILKFIISQYFLGRILTLNFKDYVNIFKESLIATFVMAVILIFSKSILKSYLPTSVLLILCVFFGGVIYILLNIVLNKEKTLSIFKLANNIVRR